MKGGAALVIGVVTVLIAIGALAFILWTITDYSEKCKTERAEVCETLNGPSFPLLIIVLIIAGLVLIASTVVYILVTA
jgi:H+/Cl- antiporter ClcA